MYVAIKGKGKNAKVYLLESYWENGKSKKRCIKYFGSFDNLTKDDPEYVSKLKALYSKKRQDKLDAKRNLEIATASECFELDKLISSSNKSNFSRALSVNYANFVLNPLWNELGLYFKINQLQTIHHPSLSFNLNSIVSNLCFQKLIDPGSILHTYNHRSSILGAPFSDVSLDQMYMSLDFLSDHKDSILKRINTVLDSKFKRTYSMVYYDVTNTYIETCLTDEECKNYRKYHEEDFMEILKDSVNKNLVTQDIVDTFLQKEDMDLNLLPKEVAQKLRCLVFLRMRGLSKEHRYDLPLISISLVIDDQAIPIDFQIYSGCASEYKTMVNSIEEMKKKYNIENTIVVADRGINSVSNMKMLLNHEYGFLVAQKISNLKDKEKKAMLDNTGYSEHVILKDKRKPQTEDNTEDIIKTKAIDYVKQDKDGNKVQCKLIFSFSKKRQERDLKIIEEGIKRAEKAIQDNETITHSKKSWVSFIKLPKEVKAKATKLNEELIQKKKELAGYAGIIYHPAPNQEKTNTIPTAKEICEAYHHLVQIEDCFRIMKTNLGLRPMYVRLEDHLEGHVMSCVLALILIRLLQIRLRENNYSMSIDKIIEALKDANVLFIPNSKGKEVFVSESKYLDIYLDNDRRKQKEEKLIKSLRKEYTPLLYNIMEVLGLKPLPTLGDRKMIYRCFKVKLKQSVPLIDPIIGALLST